MNEKQLLRYALTKIVPQLFPQLQGMMGQQQLAAPGRSNDDVAKAAALSSIRELRGGCIPIIGARNTGKTTLAARLAEFCNRPAYIVSPSARVPYSFLHKIDLDEVLQIPGGSILILDDVPTYAGSADYHDALVKVLERLVPVCRHYDNEKGVLILVITQSSSLADKHLLDADAVFLKPFSILFADTERPAVKKLADHAMIHFRNMTLKQQQKHAYLVNQTPSYEGMIRVAKPQATATDHSR